MKIENPAPRRTHASSVTHGPTFARSLWGEAIRLVVIALAVQIFLALVSYHPGDPSWSTWASRPNFQNWLGRAGSVTADCLLQLFGLASFAIVALLLAVGLRRSEAGDEKRSKAAPLYPLAFLIALAVLVQVASPNGWTPLQLRNPGGLVGKILENGLRYGGGRLGAMILSAVFFAVTAILLFGWRPVSWLSEKLTGAGPHLAEKIRKLPAACAALIRSRIPRKDPSQPVMPEPSLPVPVRAPALPPAEIKPEEEDDGLPLARGEQERDEEIGKLMATKGTRSSRSDERPKPRPRSNGKYELPPVTLLSGRAEAKTKPVDKNWYIEKGNILVQKLRDFGVEGEVVHISPGPVITVYEFKPASGVKIKDIANLSDDLTLALSVLSVRIVAPIPGKPVVGIEIPSPHREMVFFKDLIEETPFYDSDLRIPIVLGRLASGEPVVAGLASMPHLLVAGSTGTGKSVFINTLISSLLYRYRPDQLKLILVDPKMVELSTYEGIPHLMLPVVVDSKKAALALRWTVDEMERRYSLMHQTGVRHIDAYNDKMTTARINGTVEEENAFLPYIVVVIDEYADLMAVVPKDVELSIARLAQKARASGIHLVLATQRPSTDVVTGTIKANFPSRISFRVASSVDSKTILDRTGSERLLGNGDMLFHSAGFTSLKRMQGAFLSDADLERVTSFLKAQGEPEYDERILRYQEEGLAAEEGGSGGEDGEEAGDLYDRAVRLVAEKGEASISLIQRHLKIGYNRAATLMEQMEKEGVVAQATGASKRRQVLVNNV